MPSSWCRIAITNSNINYVGPIRHMIRMLKSSWWNCAGLHFFVCYYTMIIIHWLDIIAVMARPMYRYALPLAGSDQFAHKHCKVTFLIVSCCLLLNWDRLHCKLLLWLRVSLEFMFKQKLPCNVWYTSNKTLFTFFTKIKKTRNWHNSFSNIPLFFNYPKT